MADVFIDMDTEVDALEEKIYKMELMKSGMMGEPLAGRIRLL